MTDSRLRGLERRYVQGGAPADGSAYARALAQGGEQEGAERVYHQVLWSDSSLEEPLRYLRDHDHTGLLFDIPDAKVAQAKVVVDFLHENGCMIEKLSADTFDGPIKVIITSQDDSVGVTHPHHLARCALGTYSDGGGAYQTQDQREFLDIDGVESYLTTTVRLTREEGSPGGGIDLIFRVPDRTLERLIAASDRSAIGGSR